MQTLPPDIRVDWPFGFMIQRRVVLSAAITLIIRPRATLVTIVFPRFASPQPPESHVH